jgi:hypothetical protein
MWRFNSLATQHKQQGNQFLTCSDCEHVALQLPGDAGATQAAE